MENFKIPKCKAIGSSRTRASKGRIKFANSLGLKQVQVSQQKNVCEPIITYIAKIVEEEKLLEIWRETQVKLNRSAGRKPGKKKKK